MTPVSATPDLLAAAARAGYEEFARRVAGIPYESKGVLFSEMFFFLLCARLARPKRILESGRARGQSTLLLALLFPETEIVSVEYDRDSPDVAVAAERLRGHPNVQLLFGDATRLLPSMVQEGDLALIDGPKGHRGLRLAIRLLGSARVPLVFVHDAGPGTIERKFLERCLPEAIYSSAPALAGITHGLDAACAAAVPAEHRWSGGPPAAGYGFSLACLPWHPQRSYPYAMLRAVCDGFAYRWSKPHKPRG